MPFPGSIVHWREVFFIANVGISADLKEKPETWHVALASSVDQRCPPIEFIYLVKIRSILLQQEKQLWCLPGASNQMLRIQALGVWQDKGSVLE